MASRRRPATKKQPTSEESTISVSVSLDPSTVQYLRVLGEPSQTLRVLAYAAADGLARPGSWERAWLAQVIDGDWERRLRPDPELPWRSVPIAGGGK